VCTLSTVFSGSLNYCRADWRTYVLFDEGRYDSTLGRCPRGHEHMIDDRRKNDWMLR